MARQTYLLDLSTTDYGAVHRFQQNAVTARHEGHLDRDLIVMLEHPPVFTLGRRGGRRNIILPEDEIRQRGIEIVPIERGGDVTYHGPGQLVVYLIIDLRQARVSVTEFVAGLEAAMVDTAGQWGVEAAGNETYRGAWVGMRKLGSIGITVRRGITFHGLALNVNVDLEPFSWINPCGIEGCTMTSLARETGRNIHMTAVRRQMAGYLSRQFDLQLHDLDIETANMLIGPGRI